MTSLTTWLCWSDPNSWWRDEESCWWWEGWRHSDDARNCAEACYCGWHVCIAECFQCAVTSKKRPSQVSRMHFLICICFFIAGNLIIISAKMCEAVMLLWVDNAMENLKESQGVGKKSWKFVHLVKFWPTVNHSLISDLALHRPTRGTYSQLPSLTEWCLVSFCRVGWVASEYDLCL